MGWDVCSRQTGARVCLECRIPRDLGSLRAHEMALLRLDQKRKDKREIFEYEIFA